MTYQHLLIEKKGHTAIVTFNRPDALNSLSWDLMTEIEQIALMLNDDEQIRVVIFTGNGKHFSTGADLQDDNNPLANPDNSRLKKLRGLKLGPRMLRTIYEMNPITIAAVNGAALGGGACITTACDFRIGADNCRIGYPEVNLAMNLSWGALPLLVNLVGPSRAKEMVILAKKFDAETLLNWGLLDYVIPGCQLLAEAVKMAESYAAMPPVAAQMVKQSVNAITSALDQSIMHMDTDQFLLTVSSKDHEEAISAFFQKKVGSFSGN